jgi:hypothetical protein
MATTISSCSLSTSCSGLETVGMSIVSYDPTTYLLTYLCLLVHLHADPQRVGDEAVGHGHQQHGDDQQQQHEQDGVRLLPVKVVPDLEAARAPVPQRDVTLEDGDGDDAHE